MAACGPGEAETGTQTSSKKNNSEEYDLLVWEDQDKKAGIEEAVKKFEEENDVKIKVVEKSSTGRSN